MATDLSQTLRQLQQENVRLKSENTNLRDYMIRMQQAVRSLISLQNQLDQITEKTNVHELVERILSAAMTAVDSENGSLLLLDEESGELVFVKVFGEAQGKLEHFRLPKGKGVAGWVVANRTSRLVDEASKDPYFTPEVDKLTGMETYTLICVPLLDGNRVMGALEVVNKRKGGSFSEADRDTMLLVGRLASMAIVLAEKAAVEA